MGSKLAFSLAATVLAVASVAAQPLPRPLPTPHASATLADVKPYYDATERNVETEYAKLIQDAAMLAGELARAGINLPPEDLRNQTSKTP